MLEEALISFSVVNMKALFTVKYLLYNYKVTKKTCINVVKPQLPFEILKGALIYSSQKKR